MDTALGPFLASWTLMMAAMMLPSATPMIRLHRRGAGSFGRIRTDLRTSIFVSTYVLVWGAVGIVVWIVARITGALLPMGVWTRAVAAILLLAGVYQFTPLKTACLRVCRSPMDFLLTHWYPGLVGELRLGLEHGLYCLGCCWALMVVFAGAGAMSLLWAAVIMLAVFVEKVLPRGMAFARIIGIVLIGGAALIAIRPEIAESLAGRV